MPEREKIDLVIVRRRIGYGEGEPKGGVWKIAFADFMTAMMAFFLVMWLMNATNQETRESVATYFNPVKLTDSTPDRKGVNDPKKVDPGKAEEMDSTNPLPIPSKTPSPPQPSPAWQPRYDEAALFRDPYAILSEIAGGPPNEPRREQRRGVSLGPVQQQGMKGGEAYRDPFDPMYWQMSPRDPVDNKTTAAGQSGPVLLDGYPGLATEGERMKPADGKLDAAVASLLRPGPLDAEKSNSDKPVPPQGQEQKDALAKEAPRLDTKPVAAKLDAKLEVKLDVKPGTAAIAITAESPGKTSTVSPPSETTATELATGVEAALRALGPGAKPAAEVRQTQEGLLISFTDTAAFGMFAIGSAEPQPKLVQLIDKLTPMLSGRKGPIVIRGHTDARPFTSKSYDNWRLSTARAHMAYHMLVRAGLDQARVERIEGHADRTPKDAADKLAAPNRRIEILIKDRQT